MCRRSEKCVIKGSKYTHWIRLYLSFHLNWVLGLFVYGRFQNLQTSEVLFTHVITPLNKPMTVVDYKSVSSCGLVVSKRGRPVYSEL